MMGTKRTPINRPMQRRITPAAVEHFRRCLEIRAEDGDEAWEREGGRRREFLETQRDLHRALSLPPWAISPADPSLDGPMPLYMRHLCSGATWPAALELRRELEAAARQ